MTVNDYLTWAEKERNRKISSGYYAGTPTPLFVKDSYEYGPDAWGFNPDNWNGGDILRRWFVDVWKPDILLADYIIRYYRVDNQTTIYILGKNEWFEISWYKNRGRTESIKRNGQYIDLDDYIRLCNYLGIVLKEGSKYV